MDQDKLARIEELKRQYYAIKPVSLEPNFPVQGIEDEQARKRWHEDWVRRGKEFEAQSEQREKILLEIIEIEEELGILRPLKEVFLFDAEDNSDVQGDLQG